MNTFIIAAMSLDGKIAKGPEHNSYSWTSDEDKKFFIEKTKEAGVVVMGRKTWETIGKPLEGRLTIVMTRDPVSQNSIKDQIEFTNKAPKQILDDLESRGYKSTAIAGGAQVYLAFLKAGLIDEMFLTIEPVIFGQGTDLVSDVVDIKLNLLETKQLSDQSVLLRYRVSVD